MKTKSKKSKVKLNKNGCYDLFGEIPVTWPEIENWCRIVTNGKFAPENRNYFDYVKQYAVIEKIQNIKRHHGSLDKYFSQAANDLVY